MPVHRSFALSRHAVLAIAEAALLALIATALLGLMGPGYTPAGDLGGIQSVSAGKPPRESSGSATLTVTPNPVGAYGTSYSVRGSGYKVGVFVAIQLYEPGCCRFFSIMPDASGNIGFTTTTAGPGTYKVEARQQLGGRKTTLMATATFVVQ